VLFLEMQPKKKYRLYVEPLICLTHLRQFEK
jgi:hypothetical protein